MQLSILIPTLPSRVNFYQDLFDSILKEVEACNAWGDVQILKDPREGITTGEKRNALHERAIGKYVWFVDDDDELLPGWLTLLLKAFEKDPDVIGINGFMTTDGGNKVDWEIRLGYPYKAEQRNGKEIYLRHPNHITPMKREHAIKIKFPHLTLGEDYVWAKELHEAGHLKTQEVIEQPVYHYKYRSKK